MELFSIHCTTCHATLKVRSTAAIGQILACPKCDSMVQVEAPPGWTPGIAQSPAQSQPSGEPIPPKAPPLGDPLDTPQTPQPSPPEWASPIEQLGQKVMLWVAVGGAGLFLVGGITGYLISRRGLDPPTSSVVAQAPETVEAKPKPESKPAAPPAEPEPPKTEPAPPAAPVDVTEVAAVDTNLSPPTEPPLDESLQDIPLPAQVVPSEPRSEPSPPDEALGKAHFATRSPVVLHSQAPPPEASLAAARLADKLPRIELRRVPLVDFIDFMAELTMLPITVDSAAMNRAGLKLTDRVSVQKSDATIGEIFSEALAGIGLVYLVEGSQVVITLDAPAALSQIKHPVDDLAGDGPEAMDRFARLLEKLVAPESWNSAGGPGTLRVEGGYLAIHQTPVVHDELIVFCEKLRLARGRTLRSKYPPERFRLATRASLATPKLIESVTFTFHHPTRLGEIVRYLGKSTGTTILIDWRSLAERQVGPGTQITCAFEGQTLHDGLWALAEPLKLAWRPIDQDTIELFAAQALPDKLEWEFYPLAALIDAGTDANALVDEVRRSTGATGQLYFDAPSQYLLVRHANPINLPSLREGPGEGAPLPR